MLPTEHTGQHKFVIHSSSPISSVPIEPHKLAILLLWFLCAVVSDWVALAYVHDLVGWQPMDDPLFLVPQQEWAAALGDQMVSLSFVCLCLLLILHRQRLLILRRILFLLALLNTLRSAMILLTRLPSSYSDNAQRCRPQETERSGWLLLNRTWEQAIRLGLQDSSKGLLCGDQFFSGHTAMMTLSAMCLDYYVPERFHWLSYLPKLFAAVGIPCMVLSRTHYSCDVLAGYFATALSFALYHALCELDSVEARQQCLVHRTFLVAQLAHWFEGEMPMGKLHHKLELPLLGQLLGRCKRRWRISGGGKKGESSAACNTIFFVNYTNQNQQPVTSLTDP